MSSTEASRDDFVRSLDLFDTRVRAVPDDRWSARSPCEGWDARDVVVHVVRNLRGLRAGVAGGDFVDALGEQVDDDIVAAWSGARSDVVAAMDGAGDEIVIGGSPRPFASMLDALMRDNVIHTWDLARAVGGDERLPADLVDAATAAMAGVGDAMRRPGLYGPIVDAPAGADAQTRLLALSGRRV